MNQSSLTSLFFLLPSLFSEPHIETAIQPASQPASPPTRQQRIWRVCGSDHIMRIPIRQISNEKKKKQLKKEKKERKDSTRRKWRRSRTQSVVLERLSDQGEDFCNNIRQQQQQHSHYNSSRLWEVATEWDRRTDRWANLHTDRLLLFCQIITPLPLSRLSELRSKKKEVILSSFCFSVSLSLIPPIFDLHSPPI